MVKKYVCKNKGFQEVVDILSAQGKINSTIEGWIGTYEEYKIPQYVSNMTMQARKNEEWRRVYEALKNPDQIVEVVKQSIEENSAKVLTKSKSRKNMISF